MLYRLHVEGLEFKHGIRNSKKMKGVKNAICFQYVWDHVYKKTMMHEYIKVLYLAYMKRQNIVSLHMLLIKQDIEI